MVLVGNKCDLQAWAVDMNSAREVRCVTVYVQPVQCTRSIGNVLHSTSNVARSHASTAFRLSKRPPKRAWASTMRSTRWCAKSARTRRAAKRSAATRDSARIDVSSAKSCRRSVRLIGLFCSVRSMMRYIRHNNY